MKNGYIAFKDSLFGSNEDLLNEVEKYQTFDKHDTLRYATLDSLVAQRDSLHRLRTTLESSIFNENVYGVIDDEGSPLPVADTLNALYTQIALTDSLIAVEQDEINAALALRLNIADSLNSSIVAQHDFEQYELDINDIIIQLALDSVAFDATQRETIETIAAMCPLEGGIAVYKARSLLYFYNDTISFDDEALCALPPARLAEKEQAERQKEDGMKVYPNPNRGQFTVQFDSAALRTIHLYNVLGQRVYSVRTSEQLLNLDISSTGISPGLLLLEATDEGSTKVFKSKITYEK